jgi:hypothetical protein
MRDLNISYPVDRLRELVARGELGGLGPNGYSFMGALRDAPRVESETGPEVGPAARRGGRGRGPRHAHVTVLHAHRRCAGPRARGAGHRHDVDQPGAGAY